MTDIPPPPPPANVDGSVDATPITDAVREVLRVFVTAFMEADLPGVTDPTTASSDREAEAVRKLIKASVDGLLYGFQGDLGRSAIGPTELEAAFERHIAKPVRLGRETAFKFTIMGLVSQQGLLEGLGLPKSAIEEIKAKTYAAADEQAAKLYPAIAPTSGTASSKPRAPTP